MSGPVRIFEAMDALELARARTLLEAEGIAHVVEGENYAVAAGGWAFGGDASVHVLVPAAVAARARELLGALRESPDPEQPPP